MRNIKSFKIFEKEYKRIGSSNLYPHKSDKLNIDFPYVVNSKSDWNKICNDISSVGFKWNNGDSITSKDPVDMGLIKDYPYELIADDSKMVISYKK